MVCVSVAMPPSAAAQTPSSSTTQSMMTHGTIAGVLEDTQAQAGSPCKCQKSKEVGNVFLKISQ